MKKSYIFICGAPRSGTTALTNVINTFEAAHIGTEVFANYVRNTDPVPLTLSSFETDALSPVLADKFGKAQGEGLSLKFSGARVIGDKHPLYHRKLNELSKNFTDCTILFIFRDIAAVARSFQRRADNPNDTWSLQDYRAVVYWCSAASDFLEFQKSNPEQCIPIYFDAIFGGHPEENASFVGNLHKQIAARHEVGEIRQPDLNTIFSESLRNKEANSWDSIESDEKAVFESYNSQIKKPVWSYDQYLSMKVDLVSAKF